MTWVPALNRWRYQTNTAEDLDGRRVTVSSNHGCAYTRRIR